MIIAILDAVLLMVVLLTNHNVSQLNYQMDVCEQRLKEIQRDVKDIKEATGDNAFEAMLDKPIQPRRERFMSPKDLYRSHGGQVK